MSRFVLAFSIVSTSYVLLSVGVALYRRRSPLDAALPVSAELTLPELKDCFDDLNEVAQSLAKHLENFHTLLSGYDPDEAQHWSDEGALWQRQWRALGVRCRFPEVRGRNLHKEMESMAAAHDELGAIEATYTRELLRFGKEQSPRLDRVRQRIETIRHTIDSVR